MERGESGTLTDKVMRRMDVGMSPTQIDRDLGLVGGTARRVVVKWWAMDKAEGGLPMTWRDEFDY